MRNNHQCGSRVVCFSPWVDPSYRARHRFFAYRNGCQGLVELVNSHRIPNNLLTSIVTECWNLIQVFTQCCQMHNYKETNACGDALARRVCQQEILCSFILNHQQMQLYCFDSIICNTIYSPFYINYYLV